MNVREAFAALGMTPTDDVEAIRATYKRLAKELHPDVQRDSGARRAVIVRDMRLVNQARDVLLAASQRGSLVVAVGGSVEEHAAADDVWRPGAPPWPPPHQPAPRWDPPHRDPRATPAERSRRAVVRWLWVMAGMSTAALVLQVIRVPSFERALAPTPTTTDELTLLTAGASSERYLLDLVVLLLQLLYPVCVVKWWMYTNRSLALGVQGPGRGAVPVAVGMLGVLVALFWGFNAHVTHGDDLLAGSLLPEGYADAIAGDHLLLAVKAGAALVLAGIALTVSRPPGRGSRPGTS